MRILASITSAAVATVLGLAVSFQSDAALADEFPSRSIRLVVPYAPGGNTDTVARLVASHLPAPFDKQVLVENVTGAGPLNGVTEVAKADPDGYTLLFLSNLGHLSLPALRTDLTFDPVADFSTVSLVGTVPLVLVTHPSSPDSLTEFVEGIRKGDRSGGYLYGSAGIGSSSQYVGLDFVKTAKIEAQHIPYKGTGPAILDLVSGRLQFLFDAPPPVIGHIRSGALRALAVTGSTRSPLMPDTPTFAEVGYPQLGDWVATNIFLAPKGTPMEVMDAINGAITEAIRNEEIANRMRDLGIVAVEPKKPAELTDYLKQQYDLLVPRIHTLAQ